MHELAGPQVQLSLIVLTRRQLLCLIFVVCGRSTLILYMSKSCNTTVRKYLGITQKMLSSTECTFMHNVRSLLLMHKTYKKDFNTVVGGDRDCLNCFVVLANVRLPAE